MQFGAQLRSGVPGRARCPPSEGPLVRVWQSVVGHRSELAGEAP